MDFFDDSLIGIGDPIIIPPGTWDMTNVVWYVKICSLNTPPNLFTQINISDGATVNGLGGISGPIMATHFGTTSAAITLSTLPFSRQAAFYLTDGAQIASGGTQPFVRLVEGFAEVITQFANILYGTDTISTVPVVSADDASQLIIVLGVDCTLEDNAVGGTGNILCVRLTPGTHTSIPPVQTLPGTFSVGSTYTNSDTYQRPGAPTNTDDDSKGYKIGDLWIDTGSSMLYTSLNVTLNSAVWHGPY